MKPAFRMRALPPRTTLRIGPGTLYALEKSYSWEVLVRPDRVSVVRTAGVQSTYRRAYRQARRYAWRLYREKR